MLQKEIDNLIKRGYCRTSNRYGLLARIDRPDWLEYMASLHHNDMEWAKSVGGDHYRRVYSRDTIEVGQQLGRKFPASQGGPEVFLT